MGSAPRTLRPGRHRSRWLRHCGRTHHLRLRRCKKADREQAASNRFWQHGRHYKAFRSLETGDYAAVTVDNTSPESIVSLLEDVSALLWETDTGLRFIFVTGADVCAVGVTREARRGRKIEDLFLPAAGCRGIIELKRTGVAFTGRA